MEYNIIYQFTLNETEQQTLIGAHRVLREICNAVNDCKKCPLKAIKCDTSCCIATAFDEVVGTLTDI